MAKRWTGLMVAASCLAWCAAAVAQPPASGNEAMTYPAQVPQNPAFGFMPCPMPVFDQAPPPPPPETGAEAPVFSVGFEYLMRYFSAQRTTPVITQGPSTDPIPAALGQPGTRVVVGRFDGDQLQHGARVTFGLGVDSDADVSFQASGYWLGSASSHQTVSSTGAAGTPVLARPFFNVVSRVQDADPAAFPLLASGKFSVDSSRQAYGFDADLRYLYLDGVSGRMVLLVGGGYFALEERLRMQENSQDLPGQGAAGNSYYLREEFNTNNYFYGGQVGVDYQYRFGSAFLQTVGKLGIGAINEQVVRNPFTRITEASGIVTTSSDRALYIAPANAGKFSRTAFALMPEGSFRLGVDLNKNVQLVFGYSILYLTSVVRPGDQIDHNVIVQPIGTAATFESRGSLPTFHSTTFTAQGLDVALRLSF